MSLGSSYTVYGTNQGGFNGGRTETKTSMAEKRMDTYDAHAVINWQGVIRKAGSSAATCPVTSGSPLAGFNVASILITPLFDDPSDQYIMPKIEGHEMPESARKLVPVSDKFDGAPVDVNFGFAGVATMDFSPSNIETYRQSVQINGPRTVPYNGTDYLSVKMFDPIAWRREDGAKVHSTYAGLEYGRQKPILYAVKRPSSSAGGASRRLHDNQERAIASLKAAVVAHGGGKASAAYNKLCEGLADKYKSRAHGYLLGLEKSGGQLDQDKLLGEFMQDLIGAGSAGAKSKHNYHYDEKQRDADSTNYWKNIFAISTFVMNKVREAVDNKAKFTVDAKFIAAELDQSLQSVQCKLAVFCTYDLEKDQERNIIGFAMGPVKVNGSEKYLDLQIGRPGFE